MGWQEAWVRQWIAAAGPLARQRALELRQLTDDEARAATAALLDIAAQTPLDPRRIATSGLVVQQQIFQRARRAR